MVCIYKSQDIVIDDCRSKGGVEINVAIANRGGRKEQIAKKITILTPYASQICHIIIQISETQFLISIPIHAVGIGHLICNNYFGLLHSCWLWEWNLVGKIHQNTQIQQPF